MVSHLRFLQSRFVSLSVALGLILVACDGAVAAEPALPTPAVHFAEGQPVYEEVPVEQFVAEQPVQRHYGSDWSANNRSPFTPADFVTGGGHVSAGWNGPATITNVGWPYRSWYYGQAYRPWYSYYQPYYGNAYRSYYRPWYTYGYGGYGGYGVPLGIYSSWPNQSIAPQYGLGALQSDIGLFSSGAWAANYPGANYPSPWTSYYGPYGAWYAGQVAWPQGYAGYTPWDASASYGGCYYW